MYRKYMNMPIKSKLLGLAVLLVMMFNALSITQILAKGMITEKYRTAYDEYAVPAQDVAKAYAALNKSALKLEEIRIYEDESLAKNAAEEAQAALNEAQNIAASVGAAVKDEEIITLFNDAKEDFDVFSKTIQEELDAAIVDGDFTVENLNMEKIDTALADVEESMTKLDARLLEKSDEGHIEAKAYESKSSIFTYVCLAAVVAISAVSTIIIIRSIRVPLQHIDAVADRLAIGDIDVEIKHYYNDEIGALSDNLQKMIENVKAQTAAAEQLAAGNLTYEVVPASDKDVLGISLKKIFDDNNHALGQMKEAAVQVSTGAEQVAAASQALAQGSTEQASAIQQVTASIDEIANKTKSNAEDALTANRIVLGAKEGALKGNEHMADMMQAMTEINTASENISKIIKVIDDIAFQTNILALNAAVEAARAGQYGKGFAVVAEEVRNLAGKSAQAASETAELIEDSINKVGNGSKIAQETAKALDEIVQAIDKIAELTDASAVTSNEQATATAQVNQALIQVSNVVQTNSSTSEECAAASQELSAQAEKLLEMIGLFKLKTEGTPVTVGEYYGKREEKPETAGYIAEKQPVPVISLDDGFGKY